MTSTSRDVRQRQAGTTDAQPPSLSRYDLEFCRQKNPAFDTGFYVTYSVNVKLNK